MSLIEPATFGLQWSLNLAKARSTLTTGVIGVLGGEVAQHRTRAGRQDLTETARRAIAAIAAAFEVRCVLGVNNAVNVRSCFLLVGVAVWRRLSVSGGASHVVARVLDKETPSVNVPPPIAHTDAHTVGGSPARRHRPHPSTEGILQEIQGNL